MNTDRIKDDINKINEMIDTLSYMDYYYSNECEDSKDLYEYGYGVFDTAQGYLGDALEILEDMLGKENKNDR